MAKSNTKINYDLEEDILSLSKGKVKASIDVGDFIVDIDFQGFVTGLEILNASENLKLPQEQLKKIEKASMIITYKPNYVYIYLILKIEDKENKITIPLTVDLGHHEIKKEEISFVVA